MASSRGLVVKVMGSWSRGRSTNPTVYYIEKKEIKVTKWGKPKKIFFFKWVFKSLLLSTTMLVFRLRNKCPRSWLLGFVIIHKIRRKKMSFFHPQKLPIMKQKQSFFSNKQKLTLYSGEQKLVWTYFLSFLCERSKEKKTNLRSFSSDHYLFIALSIFFVVST